MGKDRINDKLKNKLAEHSVYIDKDDLWASINANQKKKRRFPFFWFLTAILFFVCIVSYFILQSINDQVNPKLDPSNTGIVHVDLRDTLVSAVLVTNKLVNTNDETQAIVRRKKTLDPLQKSLEESSIKKLVDGSSIKAHTINKGQSNNRSDEQVIVNQPSNKTSNIVARGITKKDQVIRLQSEESVNHSKVLNDKSKTVSKIEVVSIPRLDTYLIAPSRVIDPPLNEWISLSETLTNNDTPLAIWTYGGVGNYMRILSKTTLVADDIFDIRSKQEAPLYSVKLGLGVKYNMLQNLYFKSGIDFTRYTEKYTDVTTYFENVRDEQITDTHIDYSGNVSSVTSIVDGIEIQRVTSKFYNHINTFNIPILVGYSNRFSKWSTFLEMGPVFNISSQYDGHQATMQQPFEQNPEGVYKSSFGLSLEASIGLSYSILDKLDIYASPSYRFQSKSINKDSYGISQKISSLGMRIGIESRF